MEVNMLVTIAKNLPDVNGRRSLHKSFREAALAIYREGRGGITMRMEA
jgi:hypothetical protein